MGMQNPFVRWWVVFSVMLISIVTTLIAGMGSYIIYSDQTYLSWLILAIFVGGSIHLGYKIHYCHNRDSWDADSDFRITNYFIETSTSLGLLGTIIGLILMIIGAFTDIDISKQESIKGALTAISSGIGTALVTTLVGLVSALLLKLQLVIVSEKWRA